MKPLIRLFEKKNNIKVNIVSAKANQLINRIVQEGEYTNADILLTTDVGRLHIAKEKNILAGASAVSPDGRTRFTSRKSITPRSAAEACGESAMPS